MPASCRHDGHQRLKRPIHSRCDSLFYNTSSIKRLAFDYMKFMMNVRLTVMIVPLIRIARMTQSRFIMFTIMLSVSFMSIHHITMN